MKKGLMVLMLAIVTVTVFAGDMAVLENLGFSADGRYFMFGQHLLISESGQAYAEAAIVDVAQNKFVSGGYQKSAWNIPKLPNLNSRGALYELLSDTVDLKSRYGISHLEQGHLLYTRSNGDDSTAASTRDAYVDADTGAGTDGLMASATLTDTGTPIDTAAVLSFRDFERGREFEVTLNQENRTDTKAVSSAFSIQLNVTASNGAYSSYKVGLPNYYRPGIVSYRIVRIWSSPDGRSLVIAVAKEAEDLSLRYMVETLTLEK